MKFDDAFPKDLPWVGDTVRFACKEKGDEGVLIIAEARVLCRYLDGDQFFFLLDGFSLSAALDENQSIKWGVASATFDDRERFDFPIVEFQCLHSPWVKK